MDTNLPRLVIGSFWHLTDLGDTLSVVVLTFNYSLPDLIFATIHTNHSIQMYIYHSDCTSQTNWISPTRIPCLVVKLEHFNAAKTIKTVLVAPSEEQPFAAYFWEQLSLHSSWNLYWTDTGTEGRDLDIYNPVFGEQWTRCSGVHSWFVCDPKKPCNCQGYNCNGTHSTRCHAALVASTPKFLSVLSIVVVLPTPTSSKINEYNWY